MKAHIICEAYRKNPNVCDALIGYRYVDLFPDTLHVSPRRHPCKGYGDLEFFVYETGS